MRKTAIAAIAIVGLAAVATGTHYATLPPPPPRVPPVPAVIPTPKVPALSPYDMPRGTVAVSAEPYRSTNRSVAIEDLVSRQLNTGIYGGTPYWNQRRAWFQQHFYDTLAARKVWPAGEGPDTHHRGDPVNWTYEPIPQYVPPPCTQPQPTGYDAEGCRYVAGLFKDVEATNPAHATELREQVRRGRDVWYKGTFGNQDENYLHQSRVVGKKHMNYPWLDTRTRAQRFTRWGMINDPDCTAGDATTNWYDRCQDPHSSGVLGYRKYYTVPVKDSSGKVVYDPATAPYEKNEVAENRRYVIGHPCVQCHVGFDPTNPPANPNEPRWENLSGTIGNQHIRQPLAFFQGAPSASPANQVVMAGREGTIDTSLVASDWKNNPGTQNNIMDFQNRRVFVHTMRDPVTGEVKQGRTRQVLKGGEDSVGEHLALIRVYVNIGMCTEECWVPNFPYPGRLLGRGTTQSPMHIMQCAAQCDPWNYADAKMDDLGAFLFTGGPTYLMAAQDRDGTPGASHIDLAAVPQGHKVFARECAGCHSSQVAPPSIRADKTALARFYEGHVFGKEDYWNYEFTDAERTDPAFAARYLVSDPATHQTRPRQFAEKGVFGQDWLGNDERTPFNIVGTNKCRAMHDNHNKGHIWEEFASETYQNSASPGAVPRVLNRQIPGLGGKAFGEQQITGGPGYYRNISLLSVWATAPFLHNNAIGEMTRLPDGTPDYTVKGRIDQFERAFDELMTSDNPDVARHRPQKITRLQEDMTITAREDMQGSPKITLPKGTPVAYAASVDPHHPLFMACDDLVENKGHQFGVDLSPADKHALREFLKLM